MKDCTYYDMLGLSPDATDEQIAEAKIYLAKRFHPDANMNESFDTTQLFQNVMRAYQILSNPKKRANYDKYQKMIERRMNEPAQTQSPAARQEPAEPRKPMGPPSPDFGPYWEASHKLCDMIDKNYEALHKKPRKLPGFKGKSDKSEKEFLLKDLRQMSEDWIDQLRKSEIPPKYWHSHAMNWMLLQWSQNRDMPYEMLFSMYDAYFEQIKSTPEKKQIQTQIDQFHEVFDMLIRYRSIKEDDYPEFFDDMEIITDFDDIADFNDDKKE